MKYIVLVIGASIVFGVGVLVGKQLGIDEIKAICMKDKYIIGHPDAFKNANEAFEWFKENYHHRYGTIREHDGLVEIHTGGWSENELLVEKLKKTAWWLMHFRAMTTGGHYYFDTTGETGRWKIIKTNKQ